MYRTAVMVALLAGGLSAAQALTASSGSMNAPNASVYMSSAKNSEELAATIPCSMVKKMPDGSWLISGTVIVSGTTMTDVTFGGGRESPIFQSRCGKAQGK